METDKQYLMTRLKEAGLKATPQRLLIFKVLSDCPEHPTADFIFDKIKNDNPTISRGTVYNTLETLVKNNLAEKVMTNAGIFRYDANTDNHNHIYLTNTSEIVDYPDAELSQLLKDYFEKKKVKNMRITDIRLQINAEKVDPDEDVFIN